MVRSEVTAVGYNMVLLHIVTAVVLCHSWTVGSQYVAERADRTWNTLFWSLSSLPLFLNLISSHLDPLHSFSLLLSFYFFTISLLHNVFFLLFLFTFLYFFYLLPLDQTSGFSCPILTLNTKNLSPIKIQFIKGWTNILRLWESSYFYSSIGL